MYSNLACRLPGGILKPLLQYTHQLSPVNSEKSLPRILTFQTEFKYLLLLNQHEKESSQIKADFIIRGLNIFVDIMNTFNYI